MATVLLVGLSTAVDREVDRVAAEHDELAGSNDCDEVKEGAGTGDDRSD